MFIENEYTELKQKLTKDIKKEIVAFANYKGGTIYIGVADNGKVIGLNNISKDLEALSGMIREGVKTDLTLYTTISIRDIENKNIIELKIGNAPNKPYYLADKGLKSSGVFIRHGNASVPVSDENIKKMLIENYDLFENQISQNQELNFTYLNEIFKRNKLELTESKYKVLGLMNSDKLYTNLGLLFSDDCPFTIKCAIFNGNNKIEFKDRKEFSGSLFNQLENILLYLNMVNKIRGKIENYKRIDTKDYPEFALREAILNAIIHRDYNFTGSILVSIFDNRIEVLSLGGLIKGLSIQDITSGASQTRNKNIANLFYRLNYVESFGTGIERMIDVYSKYNLKPEIIVTDNTFKVILPNINYVPANEESKIINVLSQKEIIINYIKENNSIKREVIDKLLNIKAARSKIILSEMIKEELIEQVGKGKSTYYILKK